MSSVFDISGRRALVVGGTSGLGKAIGLGLAGAGAHTAITGRRADAVESATRSIRELGVGSFAFPCDATDPEQVRGLRAAVEHHFEGLDILVYAAGATLKRPTTEIALDEWRSLQTLNVEGALITLQVFFGLLRASPYARAITIASLGSFLSFHEVAAYSASKAALLSLTRSLACEWAPHGIKVNALVPGVFETDLNRKILNETPRGQELLMRTPMGRFGDAKELVGAAIFLASDAASFMTGAAIPVDGGFLASGANR